jgi:hypothetical protein
MDLSPVNRNQKFFSEEEYQYYLGMAREHMASIDSKVYFIKIIKEKSQVNAVYNEGFDQEIYNDEAVEIPALFKLESSTNETYIADKGMVRYEEYGNLKVHFLIDDLKKLDVQISYGDIIAIRLDETKLIYFEVSNDAKKIESDKLFFGYKAFWNTITCVQSNKQFELDFE